MIDCVCLRLRSAANHRQKKTAKKIGEIKEEGNIESESESESERERERKKHVRRGVRDRSPSTDSRGDRLTD